MFWTVESAACFDMPRIPSRDPYPLGSLALKSQLSSQQNGSCDERNSSAQREKDMGKKKERTEGHMHVTREMPLGMASEVQHWARAVYRTNGAECGKSK